MKTFIKLSILLAFLLFIAYTTKAQDTTRTPIGYTLDYAHLYVLVDTIRNMSQVHSIYPLKMMFSINGGKAQELRRGGVLSVWSNQFTVTVSRKKYKRIYSI